MRPGSPARRRLTPALLVMAMVVALLPVGQAATAATNTALQFNGSTQHVRTATTTSSTALQLTNFTIETWFRRTGTGAVSSSGTPPQGINTFIPLITKGRVDTDADTTGARDVNYFLGIEGNSNTLAADFEEGRTGSPSPGANHPIQGTTPIALNTWYHAAATFNGSTFAIYLNGNLEASASLPGVVPANTATAVTGFGTAFQTTGGASPGVANGFFAGQMDEIRIWNQARSQAQIQGSMDSEVAFPTTGLVGRWGMNEGTGTAFTADSIGANLGTMVASPDLGCRSSEPQPACPNGERFVGLQRPEPVRGHGDGHWLEHRDVDRGIVVQANEQRHESRERNRQRWLGERDPIDRKGSFGGRI